MNDIQKRFILFLLGCILIRTLFIVIAKNKPEYLQDMGYISILPAIGFAYIYLTKSRQTGAEVFGSNIWWNDLRPIHALLYGLFAYFAINNSKLLYNLFLDRVYLRRFLYNKDSYLQ